MFNKNSSENSLETETSRSVRFDYLQANLGFQSRIAYSAANLKNTNDLTKQAGTERNTQYFI